MITIEKLQEQMRKIVDTVNTESNVHKKRIVSKIKGLKKKKKKHQDH